MLVRTLRPLLAPALAVASTLLASTALACPTAMDCPMGYQVRDFSGSGVGVTFVANSDPSGNNVPYCIIGSPQGDSLTGGSQNDIICGGDGNDFVQGGLGNDTLDGGDGADDLRGQTGDDTITGGAGNDVIYGGLDNDTVSGGDGNDVLYGAAGNDVINGDAGNDILEGADGNDTLNGGDDADHIDGNAGNDTITGGNGNDYLNGGIDDDTISGDAGNDNVIGNDGNDTLSGGADDDTVSGGAGNDNLSGDSGDDFLDSGIGDDTANGGDGNDTIFGRSGNDTLSGGNGNDAIDGGDGNDTLNGDADNDTLTGGAGNDALNGGTGNDTLNGGLNNDTLNGNGGDDTLNGDAGADDLDGGDGTDNLSGGDGPDFLDGGSDGLGDTLNGGAGRDTCLERSGQEIIGGGCENLTHALLASFDVGVSGGQVVVAWSTAAEVGTVGFDVLRRAEGERDFVRANAHLLQAVHTSPEGGEYQFVDAGARPGEAYEYLVVEKESNGARRLFGPFAKTARLVRPVFAELPRHGFALRPRAVAHRVVPAPARFRDQPVRAFAAQASGAKVAVRADGLVRVTATELATAMGLGEEDVASRMAAGTLALSLAGTPVAWTSPEAGVIEFYGERARSLFALDQHYLVTAATGAVMGTETTTAPGGAAGGSFSHVARLEQDVFAARVIPLDPAKDYWFWHVVSPTTPGKSKATVSVPATGFAGGDAVLRVELQGASDEGIAGEHRLRVTVNGTDVGVVAFAGFASHVAELNVPAAAILAGDNEVELVGELPDGVDANFMYVNAVELEYARAYDAADGAFVFSAESHDVLEVENVPAGEVRLFNITDPAAVREVEGFSLGGGALRFAPADGATYLLTADPGVAPEDVRPEFPSALKGEANAADYVVITRGDFMDAAAALTAHHSGAGMNTMLVDLEDIYDEWSGGQPDPGAIRAFLSHATSAWATPPRYVVLAGAGHYDYRDLRGFGGNVVPPLEVGTDTGLLASDVGYADVSGDDFVPELAIGRLPAATPEELTAMIDKTVAYAGEGLASWAQEVVFVADESDEVSDFAEDSAARANRVWTQQNLHEIYRSESVSAEDARAMLLEQLGLGVGWVNYLGHGGLDQLGKGTSGLLLDEDALALTNGVKLPLVTSMTCLSAGFDVPGTEALGEALLRNANGGAVAVWGATTSSVHEDARVLLDGFMEATLDERHHVLGDAVLAASQKFAALGTENRAKMLAMYALLGDPAVTLHFVDRSTPPDDTDDPDADPPKLVDDGEGGGRSGGKAGGCGVVAGGHSLGAGYGLLVLAVVALVRRRKR